MNQTENNNIPEEVLNKAKEMTQNLPEGSGLGIMPIKLPLRTKIYVKNTAKAEELCDILCASIQGSDLITNILGEKYGETGLHFPIDTTSGDFTTLDDGSYIHIFTSLPCMVTCNEYMDQIKLVPFLEEIEVPSDDEEVHHTHNYVESIFVNDESIIQTFKDGYSSIVIFKSRMESEVFATFIG